MVIYLIIIFAIHADTTVDPKSDFDDIIGLLGPAELKHFYSKLDGLSHQDVEKAVCSANTSDVNLQAKSVLRLWHQRNGRQATRQAVFHALAGLGYRNVMEQLKRKWICTGKHLSCSFIFKNCKYL